MARVGRWEKQPTARGERWGAAKVVVEVGRVQIFELLGFQWPAVLKKRLMTVGGGSASG